MRFSAVRYRFMASADMITIEVAYATAEQQALLSLQVPVGTTMPDAIQRSGILQQFPELDPETATLGIFSRPEKVPASRVLQEGDRVEIYRPLLIDPKEARKERAEKAKKKRVV